MQTTETTPEIIAAVSAPGVEDWIRERLAGLLDLSSRDINVHKPIAAYGIDSAEAAALAEDLERHLGREIPLDLIWEWASAREVAVRLVEYFDTEDFA